MQQTHELLRASHALQRIKAISNRDADWKDKYASYVESLPATILNCGLGQAAASLLAAAKKTESASDIDEHFQLYKDLEDWLCKQAKAPYFGTNKSLIESIAGGDRSTYMHAQVEALKWLEWMKKLAVAYLKKPKGGEQ
jgi:CRISPR-associated protein Cmr5